MPERRTPAQLRARRDFERATYQRYPLLIATDRVTVFTPEGRKLAHVTSVKQARLLIRGHRRAA